MSVSSAWMGGCTLPPGNTRSSGTALEKELGQGGRGRAGRAPGGHPGVPRCQCLWQPVSSKCGSPRTSVSAPPPFLTRNMGSVLSCYTSSLLGGFWTGCHSSHAGSEGFPSLWPGRGAARGSPAASWLRFCWVWGKRGAVCNNTLSVGCPLTLSRTTLDRWGIRKSAAP